MVSITRLVALADSTAERPEEKPQLYFSRNKGHAMATEKLPEY